ncbi:MAG: hypothetical protein IT258_12190 [Saprospiraceae bacterium]|nr:hypothetical protein [Saprospiraceae bacterium]
MNFLLKNLEFELDDHYLLVAEKLLDEGKLTRLFENEPHLWIAEVDGFEVEIQISPSRVRACSCECEQFGKEKMCGHVAAGLLRLRRLISDAKPAPKASTRAKPLTYQKLTVNAVLDNVSQDELAAFVRNFARGSNQFSLALRTKFAAKVPLLDDQAKFGQLLDSAIQLHRKANDRISHSGAVQLQRILDELLGQADDAIALEHYADAWAILGAVIGRFSPIIKKLDSDEEQFQKKLSTVFEKLKQLVSAKLPPSLSEAILEFCSSAFNRPAYYLNGFSGHLLQIWVALSSEPKALELVYEAVDHALHRPKIDPSYHSVLLSTKLDLLTKPSMAGHKEQFTLECLSEPQKLLQVVEVVEPSGDFRSIKDLVEKGHRLINDEEVRRRLEPILLQSAKMEGQKDVVVSISRHQFLETKDFAFYEQCKANFKGNWPNFVKKLLAELVGRYDYRQNIAVIATILEKEAKLDELFSLLQEQRSLELLMAFDQSLLKEKTQATFQLYDTLLKEFLSNHLGVKASQKLRTIFNHLGKQGANGVSERLFVSLKSAFPKRVFYLDEIEPNYF